MEMLLEQCMAVPLAKYIDATQWFRKLVSRTTCEAEVPRSRCTSSRSAHFRPWPILAKAPYRIHHHPPSLSLTPSRSILPGEMDMDEMQQYLAQENRRCLILEAELEAERWRALRYRDIIIGLMGEGDARPDTPSFQQVRGLLSGSHGTVNSETTGMYAQ